MAFQYACCDAILVGSGTVANEPNHDFAAYTPLGWPHMLEADLALKCDAEADSTLASLLDEQRRMWQASNQTPLFTDTTTSQTAR
jgi:hypothetical protein